MQALTLERDDRRELFFLLDRLPPRGRISFLHWCCKQCSDWWKGAEVKAGTAVGETREIYFNVLDLNFAFGLDLEVACAELVRRARRL